MGILKKYRLVLTMIVMNISSIRKIETISILFIYLKLTHFTTTETTEKSSFLTMASNLKDLEVIG